MSNEPKKVVVSIAAPPKPAAKAAAGEGFDFRERDGQFEVVRIVYADGQYVEEITFASSSGPIAAREFLNHVKKKTLKAFGASLDEAPKRVAPAKAAK